MKKLISKFKRIFGLKGSWTWACRQMEKGKIVRPGGITGAVKYRLDPEGQRRIQWVFTVEIPPPSWSEGWTNAFIFLSDFESTDWEVWG